MAVALDPGLDDHVDVGIDAAGARVGSTDFQHLGVAGGLVDQLVTIRFAGLERRAVAGTQDLLTSVGDEGQFALHNPHEFFLVAVPVTLARPTPGRDYRQVAAQQPEAARTRQPLGTLAGAGLIERLRVAGAGFSGDGGKIDFFHGSYCPDCADRAPIISPSPTQATTEDCDGTLESAGIRTGADRRRRIPRSQHRRAGSARAHQWAARSAAFSVGDVARRSAVACLRGGGPCGDRTYIRHGVHRIENNRGWLSAVSCL